MVCPFDENGNCKPLHSPARADILSTSMKLLKNVSLKLYSTMRLGGTADYVFEAKKPEDLVQAEAWAEAHQLPIRIIGSGSNIIWRDRKSVV